MAFGLAVYASPPGLPQSTQDSLPAVGQTLLDGLLTRRVPTKGFRVLTSPPPFPSLAWRNHIDRSRGEAHSPPGPALSIWYPRPAHDVALRFRSRTRSGDF